MGKGKKAVALLVVFAIALSVFPAGALAYDLQDYADSGAGVYMTAPSSDCIKTAGLITENGDTYWYSEITVPFGTDDDILFSIDISEEYCFENIYLYSSCEFTPDNAEASGADGTLALVEETEGSLSFKVPKSVLSDNLEYYLVIYGNGEADKAVFKFTTALAQGVPQNTADETEPEEISLVTEIYGKEDLLEFAESVNKGCEYEGVTVNLNANIDLKGTSWVPIGYETSGFKGVFNGNNYTISNLTCTEYETGGFFARIDGAVIENITFEAPAIKSDSTVGTIAAFAVNSEIRSAAVEGADVSADSGYAGGLIGEGTDVYIEKCCVDGGSVAGDICIAGGLAGAVRENSAVSNCYVSADVRSAGESTGGIIGEAGGGSIENCYASGAVAGMCAGGLIGTLQECEVKGCFALNSSVSGGLKSAEAAFGEIYASADTSGVYVLEHLAAEDSGEQTVTEKQATDISTYRSEGWGSEVWGIGTQRTYPLFKKEIVFKVIAGETRFDTSAMISGEMIEDDGANAIIIADGLNFADGLASAAFANKINAPILMVNGTTGDIKQSVIDEINRIDSDHNAKVYVIGGELAVNSKAVDTLKNMGYANIDRIFGATRFETAIKLAEITEAKTAFIADGMNYPDALSVGSAAALNDGAVLFTKNGALDDQTKAYIKSKNFERIVIVGGTSAVSEDTEEELKDICGDVIRVSGMNRIMTSTQIAYEFFPAADTIIVSTGYNFADSLAGGPFAAAKCAPLLLIDPKQAELDPATEAYIRQSGASRVIVLGGESAVSSKLYDELIDAVTIKDIEEPEQEYSILNEFIDFLNSQVDRAIYCWGGQGEIATEELIRKKETSTENAEKAIEMLNKLIAAGVEEPRMYDCSGLGMAFLQGRVFDSDMSANGMMRSCETIERSEIKKGDWVFQVDESGKAVHIGYVVDSNLNVVEARGREYGVVKRPLSAGSWNSYGRPKCFKEYIEE